jgi:hypothetical protein
MSFNMQRLIQITGGGAGQQSLWLYSHNTDNVASMPMGTVNTTYFGAAYTTYGVVMRRNDIILASYAATASSSATGIMLVCQADWDTNGSSVIPIASWKS